MRASKELQGVGVSIMKKTLLLLFVFCLINSCSKYDIPKCDFDDATQDLLWLKDIISEREANPTEYMRYCYISQAKLKRKTVFILGDCNPAINKIIFVLDCEGNPLQDKDGRNIGVSEVNLKDQKNIWQPDDFACEMNGNTIN
ncbi:hypothetical protein [Maribacter sp. 2308TA10-17]|uniref:hypothetical protein n=1 Tax=Maribacter sp. 2308TA10-17 TaxID=3386276 RepID=UPI0039BCAFF7